MSAIFDTLDFFKEVRIAIAAGLRGENHPVPRKEHWWLTKHADAWEEATESKLKSACPFFWGAIKYLVYSVLKNIEVTKVLFRYLFLALPVIGFMTFFYHFIGDYGWAKAIFFSVSMWVVYTIVGLIMSVVQEVAKATKKPANPNKVSENEKVVLKRKPQRPSLDMRWENAGTWQQKAPLAPIVALKAILKWLWAAISHISRLLFELFANTIGWLLYKAFTVVTGTAKKLCPPVAD